MKEKLGNKEFCVKSKFYLGVAEKFEDALFSGIICIFVE